MPQEKCEQLLCFILKLYKHCSLLNFSRLCFLADYLAFEKLGRLVSGLGYRLHSFGPFNPAMVDRLESLVEQEMIRSNYDTTDLEYITYCFNDDLLMNDLQFKAEFLPDISISEFYVVRDTLYQLFDFRDKDLTRLVYNTKPLRALKAKPHDLSNLGRRVEFDVYRSA